ncbi:MAG: hypothetical protein GXP55_09285 [Deltaproteobacteria bacterium]|nr:hypothetical protein [Deltaproteobacteria bacterium]
MALLALFSLTLSACANKSTPEGFEGYITHVPLIFGQAGYVGNQIGPTSTGMVWREFVVNVDMRPKNYSEEFHILSKDNLNVGFEAHARISLKDGSVRDVVESLGGDNRAGMDQQEGLPEWYLRNVQRPYRAAVRDIVHQYDAYDIQSKTAEIGVHVLERLQEEYGDTSIVFETMSIGNLSYPDAINQEIQRKLAAEQNLERKERERQIAEQEAQIMMTDARGRAAAQRIVNETLTDLYVQHEMITGFEALARSSRTTIIAAPVGDSQSSPVILSLGQ